MRRAILTALLLVVAGGSAAASDPEVERRIGEQDRLDPARDRIRLLNEAREAVSRQDSAANRYLLGRAYGLAGEFDKAKEQFDWAVERNPSFAYGYHGLGVYSMMKGDPAEAERQFQNAIRLDPRLSRARSDLGKLYLAKDDRLAAEREFQEILGYEPDNHDVRTILAFQYMKDRKYDRAIQEFQVVLAKQPAYLQARKGYAVALSLAKRPDEAIREFLRVVDQTPTDWECYLFLKNLYLDKKDNAGAISVLERMLRAAPADAPWRSEVTQEIQRIREGRPAGPPGATFEGLLADLDSKDVDVRRAAMRTLCELDYYRLPKRMVQAVTDSDKVVRTLAVKKLGHVGKADALPLLEIVLLHPKDRDAEPEVRGAAARGLAISDTDAALPILVAALDDGSDYVFRVAVDGLRRFSGLTFTENPDDLPTASERAQIGARWKEWWAGPRAFGLKLDAIAELVRLDFARAAYYLADLMADSELPVSQAALAGYVKLTGRTPGTPAELATFEGRRAVRERALRMLGGD